MNSLILVVAACLLLTGLCQSKLPPPYDAADVITAHSAAVDANADAYAAAGTLSKAADELADVLKAYADAYAAEQQFQKAVAVEFENDYGSQWEDAIKKTFRRSQSHHAQMS